MKFTSNLKSFLSLDDLYFCIVFAASLLLKYIKRAYHSFVIHSTVPMKNHKYASELGEGERCVEFLGKTEASGKGIMVHDKSNMMK